MTKQIWGREGRAIGIVDQSDTQSYGMVTAACWLEEYNFPKEMVEYHATLFLNAEYMYLLLKDIVQNYETSEHIDNQINTILERIK